MNRRDFLRLAGLGTAGLIVQRFVPVVVTETRDPRDRVDYDQVIRHHSTLRLDNFGIPAHDVRARIMELEATCVRI